MEHRARKRFGQNFLHDPVVIDRIVRSINPKADDKIVEIGPGLGAITAPILELVDQLHVVEIDRDVRAILEQKFVVERAKDQLVIHGTDALKFQMADISTEKRSLRIIGNLPYNISTPLIFKLMAQRHLIKDMHFMLQREVVDRMVAAPGNKQYGRLGVMLAPYCNVSGLFDVGPGAFKPPPKVWSSIVRLEPWATPPFEISDHQLYADVVMLAFGQRRKTLRNSLKPVLDSTQIESIGINPTARPEVLSAAEFAAIANHLAILNAGN
jgi:16S rRNA (adenine1518-N6/adenine1519-N6)-dimethyltransferase